MTTRRAMLLLTYTLGEHVNHAEYEQWLRDVDNPFLGESLNFQVMLCEEIAAPD